ncbi:helix-turn-helix transcriptional regulator [Salmonella enterica]|nr:helix-turn-helix transcriptional regulator [Salmonella enterica]EJI5362891.1 helix-turn-helix transcriptional regulator [Salmonella enterica]
MSAIPSSIGERIRSQRELKKMTVDDLAHATGLATTTLRNYEVGNRTPSHESIKKIAKALGCLPEYLATYTDTSGHEVGYLAPRLNIDGVSFNNDLSFNLEKLKDLGVNNNQLLSINITDTAMEPLLRKGSIVIVDTNQKRIDDNEMYLIQSNSHKSVRKLRTVIGSNEVIIEAGASTNIEKIKIAFNAISIIGRVIGIFEWR